MRKQNNSYSEHQCCCQCNKNQNGSTRFNQSLRHSQSSIRADSSGCLPGRQPCRGPNFCSHDAIDDRTRQQLSSMRQKACHFIVSQENCSSGSDSSCRPCNCRNINNDGEESMIQKARDSIDYVPESEFLKRFSGQCDCRCLNNNQRQQSPKNSNEKHNIVPRVCQECIAKSTEIIKLLELLHNQGLSAANQMNKQSHGPCTCAVVPEAEQDVDRSGINQIVKTCRSVVDELKHVLTNMGSCGTEQNYTGNTMRDEMQNMDDFYPANESKTKRLKTKTQHVSRSKKRIQCRGRRKRKSIGSEKCHSQENFEPSLKKPYETSCERCWRYASPSRSPVNKPAQRFDPNFRRAHSCQDFLSNEAEVMDDDGKADRCDRNQCPGSRRITDISVVQNQPASNVNSTHVKELMLPYPGPGTPPSRYQKDRTIDEIERYISLENSDRRPRPKSCIPEPSSVGQGNFRSVFDKIEGTDYKDLSFKRPNPQMDSTLKGIRIDPSPNQSQVREKSYANNQSRNCNYDLEGVKCKGRTFRDNIRSSSNMNGGSHQDLSVRGCRRTLPSRNSSPASPSNAIGECTCNKTYTIRVEGSQYCQPNNRNSTREEPSSPGRTQSSVSGQMRSHLAVDKRPKTIKDQCIRRSQNQSPPMESVNQMREIEEAKCCNCRSSAIKQKRENFPEEGRNGQKSPCCHCNRKKNSVEPDGSFRRSPGRISTANAMEHMSDINENYFSSKENSYSLRSTPRRPESQGYAGKCGPCSHGRNSRGYDSGQSYVDNQRSSPRGNENFIPDDRRNSPRGQLQNTPKKYCVFYMTKNRSDRANDVEVLIEELTERCNKYKKDSDMTVLKDKMRKYEEFPVESMALRFQKGASESAKKLRPESSRILYF